VLGTANVVAETVVGVATSRRSYFVVSVGASGRPRIVSQELASGVSPSTTS